MKLEEYAGYVSPSVRGAQRWSAHVPRVTVFASCLLATGAEGSPIRVAQSMLKNFWKRPNSVALPRGVPEPVNSAPTAVARNALPGRLELPTLRFHALTN